MADYALFFRRRGSGIIDSANAFVAHRDIVRGVVVERVKENAASHFRGQLGDQLIGRLFVVANVAGHDRVGHAGIVAGIELS